MKTVYILISVAMLALGCKKELGKDGNDNNIELKYKEATIFNNQELITLDSLLNDSRCPKDANCIWAGNAEVRLVYSMGTSSVEFNLNTNPSFRNDTVINHLKIKLLSLNPIPESGKEIQQDEYKVVLEIKKE